MPRKVQIENRIIYIVQDYGLMELWSGFPLRDEKKEKCGNEELIGADKTARWLFDLCSYILEKLMFRNNK